MYSRKIQRFFFFFLQKIPFQKRLCEDCELGFLLSECGDVQVQVPKSFIWAFSSHSPPQIMTPFSLCYIMWITDSTGWLLGRQFLVSRSFMFNLTVYIISFVQTVYYFQYNIIQCKWRMNFLGPKYFVRQRQRIVFHST